MFLGLGPGQLVGRQVLGSPVLGDIQLSLCDKRGNLEVEVIRARGLQSKPGSKLLPGSSLKFTFLPAPSSSPAPWVKVYLVSGKKCLAKAKTSAARRTLDPLFQQQLIFHQRYGGCVLQVAVAQSLRNNFAAVAGHHLGRLRTGGGFQSVHGSRTNPFG